MKDCLIELSVNEMEKGIAIQSRHLHKLSRDALNQFDINIGGSTDIIRLKMKYIKRGLN